MGKNKYLALSALGFFLTGCTGMTKTQGALLGAVTCGAAGAGIGAVIAYQGVEGRYRNEGAGAGIGAVMGALLCGALGYLLIEESKSLSLSPLSPPLLSLPPPP